jgi:FkbM family methyltransferase
MSMVEYGKFRARVALHRLGLLDRFEHRRLRRRFARGIMHEAEFGIFRHFEGSSPLFIDVGANLGQTALSFRIANKSSPIISFEPNPDMEYSLRRVKDILGTGFEYHMHGLGSETTTKKLFVPSVRGIEFSQLATFEPGLLERNPYVSSVVKQIARSDRFDIVEKPLRMVRFDELNLRPGIVKIDAEGGETNVLQGMEETLRRDRPLIMTEGVGAKDFLLKRGYAMLHYQAAENCLRPWREGDEGLNYFFAAEERLTTLGQVVF